MILFLIDFYEMKNTRVCLNNIKIEPNFRSLFYHDSIIKTFCSRDQSTNHVHAHIFLELNLKTMKGTKLWDCRVFKGVCFVFFGFFVFFLPFYRRVRLFSRSVHAFMLSWSSWTATKSFFWHKIVFRKKYWNLNLAWETQTDPRLTSADRRMIGIVDDKELEKRKASRILQNTRINTSWAVRVNRVWSDWAEEGNDLMQIIGDSETIFQVNPGILNIIDKDELNCWLSK